MEMNDATSTFQALSHPGRLAVLRLLIRHLPDPVRPAEITQALDVKPSTLSVYLAALLRAGLVSAERDGRNLLYRASVPHIDALVAYLVEDCCRGRGMMGALTCAAQRTERAGAGPWNVLFLCTGNSARSIMAEALLRDLGGEGFEAHSAGTTPYEEANPLALSVLRRHGHDVSTLSPKPLETYRGDSAPRMDFVFTLCDRAAAEECAVWPGLPYSAHWGQPDPVAAGGTQAERTLAFEQAYAQLRARIAAFVALPLHTLEGQTTQSALDQLKQTATPVYPAL